MSAVLAAAAAVLLATPAALTVAAASVVSAGGQAAGTVPCGPGGPAATIASHHLDVEQLANARTIIAATARRGLPARAAVIAVATAVTESQLRNLPYGDRDSLGLFQQRASWGPAKVRLDPVASTGLFLNALVAVPGWPQLPVTVASDRVQRSAYPWRVARWEDLATALVASSGVPFPPPGTPGTAGTGSPVVLPGGPGPVGCSGDGGDSGGRNPLTGALSPAGLAPAPGVRGVAIRYALSQLGKPYVWGATGPDGFDCSGLTQQAWAAAGVPIPRTTFAQVRTGAPVPDLSELQPGDLLFTAGSDGTPANPGHVGLFTGPVAGTPALVQAPHTGSVVQVTPVADWAGQIVAVRRPTTAPTIPRR